MTDEIKTGTILIEQSVSVPGSAQFDTQGYCKGWRAVTGLNSDGVDRKIRAAGWAFFFMAGEIRATVFGGDAEKATRGAIQRLLEKLNPEKFNSLQITEVASKRFFGFPYISVSAHWRHIQESIFLNRRARLADWDHAHVIQTET